MSLFGGGRSGQSNIECLLFDRLSELAAAERVCQQAVVVSTPPAATLRRQETHRCFEVSPLAAPGKRTDDEQAAEGRKKAKSTTKETGNDGSDNAAVKDTTTNKSKKVDGNSEAADEKPKTKKSKVEVDADDKQAKTKVPEAAAPAAERATAAASGSGNAAAAASAGASGVAGASDASAGILGAAGVSDASAGGLGVAGDPDASAGGSGAAGDPAEADSDVDTLPLGGAPRLELGTAAPATETLVIVGDKKLRPLQFYQKLLFKGKVANAPEEFKNLAGDKREWIRTLNRDYNKAVVEGEKTIVMCLVFNGSS